MSNVSDNEELEALKRWWAENGRPAVAGVVIAVVALVGWQQWNSYKQARAEAASSDYAAFLEQIQSPTADEGAAARGAELIDQYGNTAYGPLAAFWLARYHVEHDQLDQAAARLQWALDKADTDAMRDIARWRLARVLLAQQQYDQALKLISAASNTFSAEYQELRGDILAAQGKSGEAADAYRKALAAQDLASQSKSLIQLKLNDLGVAEEPVS